MTKNEIVQLGQSWFSVTYKVYDNDVFVIESIEADCEADFTWLSTEPNAWKNFNADWDYFVAEAVRSYRLEIEHEEYLRKDNLSNILIEIFT